MNACISFLTFMVVSNWAIQAEVSQPRQATGQTSLNREGAGTQTRQTDKPAPEILVRQAISALEGHGSITARIRQKVNLFDQELFGAGSYMEQRTAGKLRFRMELRIQADADREPSSLLKVFDGRYLWTYRNLDGSESLGRINVEDVTRGLEESGRIAEFAELGRWPGLGGLPRLLRGLNLAFDFGATEAEPVRLRNRMPGWKIVGLWKPDQLAKMASNLKEPIEGKKAIDPSALPAHIPNSVALVLGQKDLFPYEVQFRRGKRGGPAGANADRQGITLELLDVEFDRPAKPAWFIYNPGDLSYADQTREFLKSLGGEE